MPHEYPISRVMGRHKCGQIDQIKFEDVSYWSDNSDPVLSHVDLEIPMDQTFVISSSNPMHAVQFLQILAGRVEPKTGKIKCYDEENSPVTEQDMVASYFESVRPSPVIKLEELLKKQNVDAGVIDDFVYHFDFERHLHKEFKQLSYEEQKIILMVLPTLKMPQMLILEDPALGLKEKSFLTYLDWIQLWQRQGHLRHIFLTNNHPSALRYLDAGIMHVEDGLVYVEEPELSKKIVHF